MREEARKRRMQSALRRFICVSGSRTEQVAMPVRAIVCAILAVPSLAHAQFSLVATQIGPKDEPIGDPYIAICAKDACRVTLPVYVERVGSVLNVRVSAPTRQGMGSIIFAAGPRQGGYDLAVDPGAASANYQLDPLGAMTRSYFVSFVRKGFGETYSRGFLNDGVVRPIPGAELRLDLIATGAQRGR